MRSSKSPDLRRLFRVLNAGILILLAVALLILLSCAFLFRGNGAAPSLFGYHIFIVSSPSMEPVVPQGSAVMAKKCAPEELTPNSIILYQSPDGKYKSVGRIISAEEADGVKSFVIKGDANTLPESSAVSQGQVLSKVQYVSQPLGMFLSFATSPSGVFLIAVLPCLLIIVMELTKLMNPRKHLQLVRRLQSKEDSEPDADAPVENEGIVIDSHGKAEYRTTRANVSPMEIADILRNPSGVTPVKEARPSPPPVGVGQQQAPQRMGNSSPQRNAGSLGTGGSQPSSAKKLSVDDILAFIDKEEVKMRYKDDGK